MDSYPSPIPIRYLFKVSENELRMKFQLGEQIVGAPMYINGCPGLQCGIYLSLVEQLNENGVQEKSVEANIALLNYKYDLKIGSHFVFYIKSANFLKYGGRLFTSDMHSFGEDLCTFTELFDPEKKFIVDRELIIEMKGFIYIFLPNLNRPNFENRLGEQLWMDDDEKDITIIVVKNESKAEINIHKSVLSARSPVFKRMFKTDMTEMQKGKVEIIDFDLDTVKSAVAYCYDQGICDPLDWQQLMALIRFADKYDIKDLQQESEHDLLSVIHFENNCEITNAVIKLNFQKLQDFCFRFLLLCLREGIPIKDVEILDKEFASDLLIKASSIEYC